MNGRKTRVTVFMTVYNASRFIEEAVDSMLGQEYGDFRLLMIDDGSDRETKEIMADMASRDRRIRIVGKENGGVADARNFGIPHVDTELVAMMDADDISLPPRLARQIRHLDENPSMAGVGSRYYFIDELGRRTGPGRFIDDPTAEAMSLPIDPGDVRRQLLGKGTKYFLHGSATFRTNAIRKMGGYRTQFRINSDIDFNLRLLTSGYDLGNVDETLFLYRHYEGNNSAPSLRWLITRLAALTASRYRLAGRPDPVDGLQGEMDYQYLMSIMRGTDFVPWLEWIGVLQFHVGLRPGAMLDEAWRHVLSMRHDAVWASEIVRHWRRFAVLVPDASAMLGDPLPESVGAFFASSASEGKPQ